MLYILTNPNSISINQILETKEFSDFLNSARNFCSFIETENSSTENEFLLFTQNHLLTLYSTARLIPSVILKSDKNFEVDIPSDELKQLLQFIANRLPFSSYWAVLNPLDNENLAEAGTGDLVDDLSDTYANLKEALIIFDKDDIDAQENAIWKFKFDFDNHWGEHCIEALNVIHHYLNADK